MGDRIWERFLSRTGSWHGTLSGLKTVTGPVSSLKTLICFAVWNSYLKKPCPKQKVTIFTRFLASKGYEENFFFCYRPNDGVYYNELETRVRLSKRVRQKDADGADGLANYFNTVLQVKHRENTEDEDKAQKMRENVSSDIICHIFMHSRRRWCITAMEATTMTTILPMP